MPRKPKSSRPAKSIVSEVNAKMGKDVLHLATDPRYQVRRVPTGVLAMERVTGGGFVRGRHVELFGDESAGKSLVAYQTMALAQARGEICALIDGEHVFDEQWFVRLGGVPDDLVLFQPDNAEEAIKVLMLFAESSREINGISVCCIDSVASMLPKEELEKDVEEGDDRVASRARMMSRLLRRVTAMNRNTLFLWTNHVTDKIGSYGGGWTTPGGRALRFYATTRIEMRKGERIKEDRMKAKAGKLVKRPTVIGHWVQLRAEKEKSGRPYLESSFFFNAENGAIDEELSLLNLALEDGLVELKGTKYFYCDTGDQEWWGTKKQFKQHLADEADLREEIEWAVREYTRELSEGAIGDNSGM